MAGQPKPAFYAAVFLVIVALTAFAGYQARHLIFPKPQKPVANNGGPDVKIDPNKIGVGTGDGSSAEAASNVGITTVKEVTYKPSERLPPVKGTAQYKKLADNDNTVRFALNVWAGWAPIVLANEGFQAKKLWKT